MRPIRSVAVLLCAAALTSCDKNAVQDITGPLPSARIKFYNFGVNAPGVHFYANDRKMTAINSATGVESTIGTTYTTGVASGDRYSGIDPGQYTFSGRIAATVDKDLPISNVVATIADGKYYSFFQSGIYNSTTKTVDAFIVEDPIPADMDFTVAYVRFVHAISNANPMTLYITPTVPGTEIAVGGLVPYKSAGAFTAVPSGVYNLNTRYAGLTTNAISRTAVSFSAGRVYTIAAKGDITITGTTNANRPLLDNTLNR